MSHSTKNHGIISSDGMMSFFSESLQLVSISDFADPVKIEGGNDCDQKECFGQERGRTVVDPALFSGTRTNLLNPEGCDPNLEFVVVCTVLPSLVRYCTQLVNCTRFCWFE